MRLAHSVVFGLVVLVSACGGSSKPAEEPEEKPSAAADKAEDAAEGADAEESKEKADDAAKKEEPAKAESASDTSGPSVKRTPKDLLTAPDVIFMFSFNASDMKQQAEERCQKKAKGDPKKNADCMTKEKTKVDIDGMRFKQEKGRWYWMLVKRKGKTLVNVHKLPVDFTSETDTSIVLKPVGKDEGQARGKGAPGDTKVEVPNEYEISMQDPSLGKMVFEAKIGLEGEQQR